MLKYFEKGGGGGQTGVSLKKKLDQDLFYAAETSLKCDLKKTNHL